MVACYMMIRNAIMFVKTRISVPSGSFIINKLVDVRMSCVSE